MSAIGLARATVLVPHGRARYLGPVVTRRLMRSGSRTMQQMRFQHLMTLLCQQLRSSSSSSRLGDANNGVHHGDVSLKMATCE